MAIETAEHIEAVDPEDIEQKNSRCELVFGLVGPTGVDLTRVCEALTAQLRAVAYEVQIVTLSELILPFKGKVAEFANEYERIHNLMTEGTDLRRETRQADIIARLGIAKIRSIRKAITGNSGKPVKTGIAYIVRSFKRPEEVNLFREVYGKAFTLVSVYAPRQVRKKNLAEKFQGIRQNDTGPEELAVRLIAKDFAEEGQLGQQVSNAFPLADFFLTSGSLVEVEANLRRLVRLTFGDPYISPTRDEQGMFLAQAAALRSLDLSRQVGAAITTGDGDILATGCNEVPKFGGGLYWDGDEGLTRDVELGFDSNARIKRELVADAFQRMQKRGWLTDRLQEKSPELLAQESIEGEYAFFRDSRVFDVIEFGRAVHAEMAAITQAARHGTALQDAILYCTTFPCHICARHIVASGIKEVLFIEPYEKSRTDQLYTDSISVEPHEPSPKRANFRSFVGVAPRRYMDFFSVVSDRKTKDGRVISGQSIALSPKVKRIISTYVFVERRVIAEIVNLPRQKSIEGDSNENS